MSCCSSKSSSSSACASIIAAAAGVGIGIGATLGYLSTRRAAGGAGSSDGCCAKKNDKPVGHYFSRYKDGERPGAKAADGAAGAGDAAAFQPETDAADREAFWFEENLTPVLGMKMALESITFDSRSTFQRVQVISTKQFGKTLVMDGQTQSAEADEHVYHESLVHPAMLAHPNPTRVFIGGGGEFATAREVLRHRSVTRCVMVDIDEVACDICREQLPAWNAGAYEDPRFAVYYEDAKAWLEQTDEQFDVIIMDICDPIEAGPGYKLYTEEFYRFCVESGRLAPGGMLVTQSGPGAIFNVKEECFTVIHRTLAQAFNCVLPYSVDVPSFGCPWGFNLATRAGDGSASAGAAWRQALLDRPTAEVDATIAERITGELKFLDGQSLRGILGVAKSIRQQCAGEDRIMTVDNPVFMYSG